MAYALAGGLCVGFGACGSAAHRPFGPGRAFERALGGHVRGWRRCLKPPAARAQTHKSSQLHQFLHHSSLAPHTLCTLHHFASLCITRVFAPHILRPTPCALCIFIFATTLLLQRLGPALDVRTCSLLAAFSASHSAPFTSIHTTRTP